MQTGLIDLKFTVSGTVPYQDLNGRILEESISITRSRAVNVTLAAADGEAVLIDGTGIMGSFADYVFIHVLSGTVQVRFQADGEWITVERVLLTCAGLAVLVGLLFLLRPKRRHRGRPQASQWLEEGRSSVSTPGASSVLRARVLALERTRNAAVDLGRRNVTKQRDIDRAQLALVLAATLLTALGLTVLFRDTTR